MAKLLREIERRWREQFAALAAGDDVTPAQRLRAEGMMESAVWMELATAEELQEAMERCYEEIFGCSLAEQYGGRWTDIFPFPQIPAMGVRAPVYPSTRD